MGDEEAVLDLHGVAHGGEAVGRLPDGRACFVGYAIPGERVRVRVVETKGRWARAELLEVLEPSPDRVEPPCPYFGRGRCGGCQLQHVAPERQLAWKQRVVTEQLARLGGVDDPPVTATVAPAGGWPQAYRSWARFAVDPAGRLGYRRAGSHDVLPIDRCLLLDDATQQARDAAGDAWEGAEEVLVTTGRAAPAGGDGNEGTAAVLAVRPGAGALPPLPGGPAGLVVLSGADPAVLRDPGAVVHRVGGTDLRVTAGSFFQPGPAGAGALVDLVLEAAGVDVGDTALDLYAGVGLFSVALARAGAAVVAVERARSAVRDAEVNVGGLDVEVRRGSVEHEVERIARSGERFDVVVLDPPRAGAGPRVATAVAGLAPRTIVVVACDVAPLARDARALRDAGYRLMRAVPVDQFGHTASIEVVASFARADAA